MTCWLHQHIVCDRPQLSKAGGMDLPEQSGSLHSSYGHREAQLCHCEPPPMQWTVHYCHPADRGKQSRISKRQIIV